VFDFLSGDELTVLGLLLKEFARGQEL